jgi:hypothetical protein
MQPEREITSLGSSVGSKSVVQRSSERKTQEGDSHEIAHFCIKPDGLQGLREINQTGQGWDQKFSWLHRR